jgi:hypothetical protein
MKMDYTKDISPSKGLIKDDLIGKEPKEEIVFLIKKSEKLSSALYRVTCLLHDKEPLKWRLRGESLKVLTGFSESAYEDGFVLLAGLDRVARLIATLEELLSVARYQGEISEMNFSVLLGEYQLLRRRSMAIALSGNTPTITGSISPEETIVSEEEAILYGRDLGLKDNKRHKMSFISNQAHLISPLSANKTYLKTRANVKENDVERELIGKVFPEKEIIGSRKDLILSFIRKKGTDVSIKDIALSESFRGRYGEKTIQRDLTELINRGVLKKRGERRWSRYFI